MFTTPSSSVVHFERNEYYPGETINVRYVCDNSQCDKAVKNFKVKLQRRHFGKDLTGWATESAEYIETTVVKAECPAKSKKDCIVSIQIPTTDVVTGTCSEQDKTMQ